MMLQTPNKLNLLHKLAIVPEYQPYHTITL